MGGHGALMSTRGAIRGGCELRWLGRGVRLAMLGHVLYIPTLEMWTQSERIDPTLISRIQPVTVRIALACDESVM